MKVKQDGPTTVSVGEVALRAEDAEVVEGIQESLAALEQARDIVKSQGLVDMVTVLESAMHEKVRQRRALSATNPAVAAAMLKNRDAEFAALKEKRRLFQQASSEKKRLKQLRVENTAASAALRKANQALKGVVDLTSTKMALRTFTVEVLGRGHKIVGGGAAGRKARHELMERVAKHGAGLSPEQRNDWLWFKDAWDAHQLEEHAADWPEIFAGYMQGILDLLDGGDENAFSSFVHSETQRCLNAAEGLRA